MIPVQTIARELSWMLSSLDETDDLEIDSETGEIRGRFRIQYDDEDVVAAKAIFKQKHEDGSVRFEMERDND